MTRTTRLAGIWYRWRGRRFAREYAKRSGATVAFLRAHGLEPRPCHCGESICRGWQMAHVNDDDAIR